MMSQWLEYQTGIEQEQPGEAAMIDEIVASMARLQRKTFDQHRHAMRDAHAKTHGVLKGTLTVDPALSPALEQGMFQRGHQYPVVARWSSSQGDIHPDDIRSLKGLAIKAIGVAGARLLPASANEVTQDFLLVNLPILPFGDVSSYLEMQRKQEAGTLAKGALLPALASGAADALKALGLPNRTLEAIGPSAHHLLGETFHSMGAIRFGRYVAKLSLAPLSDSVRLLTGQEVDADGHDSLYRDLVLEFFREQSATYQLRAQLCYDLASMPIEDASVEWPAERSPHLPLGTITFPMQNSYSPARRVYADEILSFNPWQGIAEHRPLGSIMRARIKAYEASTQFRHAQNARTRVEPRGIDEIPD